MGKNYLRFKVARKKLSSEKKGFYNKNITKTWYKIYTFDTWSLNKSGCFKVQLKYLELYNWTWENKLAELILISF